MQAVYENKSAVVVDKEYLEDVSAGLGKMEYENIFQVLEDVTQKVLRDSNLENFHDTLLILGSSVGGMQECEDIFYTQRNYKNIDPNRYSMNVLTEHLDKKFGFYDTRAISTACTSSANALLLAKRLIDVEAYENILVIGADGLCYSTVLGFHALGVLSNKQCTPFDKNRNGMNVAEAVAALLIQSSKTENSIELKGVGASSDAYHITNPDPQAGGAIKAMQNALKDAKLDIKDIDYVNAHGTATLANDKVEALAIHTLLGSKVPVSSTKAITGHTLGAAGAVEAIVSCEVIRHSLIPAQTGLIEQEYKEITIPNKNIKQKVNNVLSNSFAFGGNNASILIGTCS